MLQSIKVLDKGYVRVLDCLGTDLTVVNAARASFDKESKELTKADKKLINYLTRNKETSPFRHAVVQYEICAPLLVARQWWRYVVASASLEDQQAWNEISRRYVTMEPIFYVPECDQWRGEPDNKKQGSKGNVDLVTGTLGTSKLRRYLADGVKLYEEALTNGVCAEQARLFLPAYGMYTKWRWTASLNSVAWFLAQRLGHNAQHEIYEYALAVYRLTRPLFPYSLTRLVRALLI